MHGRLGSLLVVLGGGAVAVAVVGFVLAVVGLDEQEPAGPAAPRTEELVDERFGVRLRHPSHWERLPGGEALRLTAPDRGAGVSITTVASRPAVAALHRGIERRIAGSLEDGRVLRRGSTRIAGEPATRAEIEGRNARGETVQLLAITVASRWRTYAIAVAGAPGARPDLLAETQSVLASLDFVQPGRARRE